MAHFLFSSLSNMKFSIAMLAMASAGATAAPCDPAALTTAFGPVLASPSYPKCAADTGYQLASLIAGPLPTSTQATALVKSDNCQALYTGTLQKVAGSVSPSCTLWPFSSKKASRPRCILTRAMHCSGCSRSTARPTSFEPNATLASSN